MRRIYDEYSPARKPILLRTRDSRACAWRVSFLRLMANACAANAAPRAPPELRLNPKTACFLVCFLMTMVQDEALTAWRERS